MSDQSVAALDQFLQYLGSKGMVTPAVAASRRAAVGKLFGVLHKDETGDVFALDFEEVGNRFADLHKQEYKPGSMQAYISRARSSIEDFRRYLDDPVNFKTAKADTQKTQKASKKGAPTTSKTDTTPPEGASDSNSGTQMVRESVFPIPIRQNLTIKVYGLPFDLTKAEAQKIANVILAMAT
jgi:hypothetical protein